MCHELSESFFLPLELCHAGARSGPQHGPDEDLADELIIGFEEGVS